jgi:SpoVK/Ycf46/Vps4 family AAA+-type ATPase
VGKTYTVGRLLISKVQPSKANDKQETIANNTRRPLISLTIADLGTEEDAIESRLTQWFALAQKWRAILLLDEADIFLERREHKDISRNGIVSVFLRKMEYFNGLLFLTTNRVGHIDEAFISRAHVIIAFEKLDVERRRMIWKSFLSKLHAERKGQIRVGPSAEKFLLQSDEMGNMDWNGREIRNAFQTAIALAEYDARSSEYFTEGDEIIVDADHFRTVMEMSHSFRAYMDSIRRDTEEQRARQFYGRNDFFSAQALAAGHREGNAENSRLEVPRPSTPALPQFRRAASPRPGGLR